MKRKIINSILILAVCIGIISSFSLPANASGMTYPVQDLKIGQLLRVDDMIDVSTYNGAAGTWSNELQAMRVWYWDNSAGRYATGCLFAPGTTSFDSCTTSITGSAYALTDQFGFDQPFQITAVYFGRTNGGANPEAFDIDITYAPNNSVNLFDVTVNDNETAYFNPIINMGSAVINYFDWQVSSDDGATWSTITQVGTPTIADPLQVTLGDAEYQDGNLFRLSLNFDANLTMISPIARLTIITTVNPTEPDGPIIPGVPATGVYYFN